MSGSDEDQPSLPDFEGFSDPLSSRVKAPGKRKRDEESKSDIQKSKKRKRSKKPKDVDDETLDTELGVNHAVRHMDSRLIADLVTQRTKRFRPELSLVEIEDNYIQEKAILDTTSWDKPRTAEQLADFLERFAGSRSKKKGQKLLDAPLEKGHPHTLVVSGAALRAADLTRALRKFQTKQALVAKLFAKHIKFKEAVETVKKNRINIGVGTPQRIFDLLEDGALSSSCVERIIIDASHIDQKKRGILDMKETQMPLVQLLTRSELKERYGAEGADGSKVYLLFF